MGIFYNPQLQPNGQGGVIVTFEEVPEAITEGATTEEALSNAIDALELALLGYVKDGQQLPAPPSKRGANAVFVGAPVAAKLALNEAFRASGMSKSALARKLGKDEAEVRRMLDPHHATKLASLDDALHALGKRLSIVVEDA
jgi:antitoxin HicB